MKAFKMIKGGGADGTDAFQLLADETRRRIIYLLRAKEHTVSQMAAELELTPQAIYHHIRKLRDADLVEVSREERIDHFIETYFRATAEVFYVEHGEGEAKEMQEKRILEALASLDKIGMSVPTDPETVSKVLDLEKRLAEMGKAELTDKVAALTDVDFLTRQSLVEYAALVSMTDDQFEERCRLMKELRKYLRGKIAAKPAKAKKGG